MLLEAGNYIINGKAYRVNFPTYVNARKVKAVTEKQFRKFIDTRSLR